jgi:hypothetical protein
MRRKRKGERKEKTRGKKGVRNPFHLDSGFSLL